MRRELHEPATERSAREEAESAPRIANWTGGIVRFASGALLATLMLLGGTLEPASGAMTENDFDVIYFDITSGRIAFVATDGQNKDIFVVDFKDLTVTPVVTSPVADESPMFSPDGKKIAFHSDMSGDREIYVANSDGTDVLQLTNSAGDDENPSWSPDGKKLVFQSVRNAPGSEIYIMNADGTGQSRITDTKKKNVGPRWSPRGDELLYATNVEWPGWDVVVHTLKTNESRIITKGLGSYTRPAWHPDGSQFAFTFGTSDEIDIWIAFKGKSQPAPLVRRPGRELDPTYDTDGQTVFFVSEQTPGAGDFQLYLHTTKRPQQTVKTDAVPTDQEPIVQLMKSKYAVRQPTWTPFPSLNVLIKEEKRKREPSDDKGR